MTATFTAIPVGQGDAFLLERADGTTILVDGGRARTVFASQFMSLRPTTAIDVVVCTHADADHAEGLVGLLEASLTTVREVWLPGRWTERLVQLCDQPANFLEELVGDVMAEKDAADLESLGGTESVPDADEAELDPERIDAALGSEGRLAPDILDALGGGGFPWAYTGNRRGSLLAEAVQVAARIRKVARSAHHHGARIRWFDFELAQRRGASAGGEPFLRPVNSVELTTRVLRPSVRALGFLGLSVANRESLVFMAPEDAKNSAVVFCADSDLTSVRSVSARRTPVVTAPHHGAEANARAYDRIRSALPPDLDPQWVRSDGNYHTRPGATYLDAAHRVCTVCRASPRPKQLVHLLDGPGGWQLAAGTHACACK